MQMTFSHSHLYNKYTISLNSSRISNLSLLSYNNFKYISLLIHLLVTSLIINSVSFFIFGKWPILSSTSNIQQFLGPFVFSFVITSFCHPVISPIILRSLSSTCVQETIQCLTLPFLFHSSPCLLYLYHPASISRSKCKKTLFYL